MEFCQSECINPAKFFFFKGNNKYKVCDEATHCPRQSTPLYPIEHSSLLTSPTDLAFYQERKAAAAHGQAYLQSLLTAAETELEAAVAAMESHKLSVVKAVTESYDAAIRRAKQHFHQIAVAIADHRKSFDDYLRSKEKLLTDLEQLMMVSAQFEPPILRWRAFDVQYRAARLVKEHCIVGDLPFDAYLSFVLQPAGRYFLGCQLLCQAEDDRSSNKCLKMFKAIANCSEATKLLSSSSEGERANQLLEGLTGVEKDWVSSAQLYTTNNNTEDPESVKQLIRAFTARVLQSTLKHEIELQLLYITEVLWPLSQSKDAANALKYAADHLLSLPDYCDYASAEETYLKSLSILQQHFPEDEDTLAAYKSLCSLYFRITQYEKAEKNLQAALCISEKMPDASKETADISLMLGRVFVATSRSNEAKAQYSKSRRLYRHNYPGSLELAQAYFYSGELETQFGDVPKAQRYFEKAQPLFEQTDPASLEAGKTHYNLGVIYKSFSHIVRSRECFQAAVSAYEQTAANSVELGDAHKELGELIVQPKTQDEQSVHSQQSDDRDIPEGLTPGQYWDFCRYGVVEYQRDQAESSFRAALGVYQSREDRVAEVAKICEIIVDIQLQKKSIDDAHAILTSMIRYDEETMTQASLQFGFISIAVHFAKQQYSEIEALISLILNHASLSRFQVAELYNDMGVTCYCQEQYFSADYYYREAFKLFSENPEYVKERRYISMNLALLHQQAGNKEACESALAEAYHVGLTISQWIDGFLNPLKDDPEKHLKNMSETLRYIFTMEDIFQLALFYGSQLADRGATTQAYEVFQHWEQDADEDINSGQLSIPYLLQNFQPYHRLFSLCFRLYFNLGVLSLQQQDYTQAKRCFNTFLNVLSEDLPTYVQNADGYLNLAVACMKLREFEEAGQHLQTAMAIYEELAPDSENAHLAFQCLSVLTQLQEGGSDDTFEMVCVPFFFLKEPLLSEEVRITAQRLIKDNPTMPIRPAHQREGSQGIAYDLIA